MTSSKTEHQDDLSNEKAVFIEVAVSTTSGFFPSEGFDRVPAHQKIRVQLDKAAKELKLASTEGWAASVNKNPIKADLSYEENGLSGTVEIDWGPHEGGGGNA